MDRSVGPGGQVSDREERLSAYGELPYLHCPNRALAFISRTGERAVCTPPRVRGTFSCCGFVELPFSNSLFFSSATLSADCCHRQRSQPSLAEEASGCAARAARRALSRRAGSELRAQRLARTLYITIPNF